MQLLLKLELEDPFRDKKAKKTGISQNSIDKIKANYELLESFNELEDYEKRVVLSCNNADAAFNFVNTIKMFRESLSHFLAVTVKNYSFFVSDFFLDIIKQLNIWSNKIVDFKDGRLNQKITGKPSININGNTMTAYFNNIGNLRLDIKTGVISAIDELSETFYDLDEKTKTYRRKNWAEELSEEHEELKKWYGTTSWDYLSENIDFRKASNEFKMDGTIYNYSDMLNDFYEMKLPGHLVKRNNYIPELDLKDLNNKVWEYLKRFYIIRLLTIGIDRNDMKENLYVTYDNYRIDLYGFSHAEVKFDYPMMYLELEFWRYAKKKNYPDWDDLYMYDEAAEIIDSHLKRYKEKCDIATEQFNQSINEHIQTEATDVEYAAISDNLNMLSNQCEDIIDNMLSMILKLEHCDNQRAIRGEAAEDNFNMLDNYSDYYNREDFVNAATEALWEISLHKRIDEFFKTDNWECPGLKMTPDERAQIKKVITSGFWVTDMHFTDDYNNHKIDIVFRMKKDNEVHEIFLFKDLNMIYYQIIDELQNENESNLLFSAYGRCPKFFKNTKNLSSQAKSDVK